MKKIMNKKGFTLAELLVVVAIIAILVAVSIPIFTAQMEKSREATDIANMRAAKAEAVTTYLTGDTSLGVSAGKAFSKTYSAGIGKLMNSAAPCGKGTTIVGDAKNTELGYDPSWDAAGKVLHVSVDKDGVVTYSFN